MKWAIRIGLLVAGVIAIVAGIGWSLPVAHTASRQTTVAATPAEVYAVISDVERYPTWWPEISRVEMLPSASGRIRFREHMRTGPVIMEVEEAASPSRLVTRIADPDQPFGGTWTFDLAREGTGTRVTLIENGEVYNPIFRFMARFVFGYTGTIESCLRALDARLRQ